MEDRTEEDIIIVDLKSKESLKNALAEYKEKIVNDDLEFGSGDEYFKCFMKSVDGEIQRIGIDDIEDIAFVDEVLEISFFRSAEGAVDEYYEPFSNVVVFAAALAHEDLLEDMLAVANETVNLVKALNDPYGLTTDECHVFGVEALVAFALKNPEYTYLISEYILSDWDSEHVDYVYRAMLKLKEKWGFDRNIIKAIAYCKDEEFLNLLVRVENYDYNSRIFSYEYPLLKHFRENPDDYNYFKAHYIASVKKNQLEPRNETCFSTVEVLFAYIASELKEQEMRTEILVEDTYENELAELTQAFDAAIDKDFRKPVYNTNKVDLDKIRHKYVPSRRELPSKKPYKVLKKEYDECLVKFCRESIIKDIKGRDATEEEKAPHEANCKVAAEIITSYLFEGESFDRMKSIVMPMLSEYIDNSLNKIIWEFGKELRNRALYMYVKFSDEECVFDFWFRWQFDKKENTGLAFFNLLIELDLGVDYAFSFLIRYYMRTSSYLSFEENTLAIAFHILYPKYDLYEEIKTLPANLIVFALEQAVVDETFRPQLEKFANHINRRVRTEASILLEKYNS